jgi:hypothetical protein
MNHHLLAVVVLSLLCTGAAGATPGTVLRVSDAHPCGEVVQLDGGWTCAPLVDGGSLEPGWYVTQPQMVKLGAKLTDYENENARLKAQHIEVNNQLQTCQNTPCPAPEATKQGGGFTAFLVGLVLGIGGAFALLYVVTR